MTIRFDDAWKQALAKAHEVAATSMADVTVIRDLLGRISYALDSGDADFDSSELQAALAVLCGPFTAPKPVVDLNDLVAPDSIRQSIDRHVVVERSATTGEVSTLERGLVGAEWLRPSDHPADNRIALYGFKGGVGRSTATFLLARHLARAGKCVLVVDLDLESPGVSSLLQPEEQYAEHGVVDHLVESAVDNADDLDLVVRSSTVGQMKRMGEVWLASAAGRRREGYEYVSKLNRAYTDLPHGTAGRPRSFSQRLKAAIDACEQQVIERSRKPDVVLLDSRAGIHDVAAIAITQLSSLSLLFATDSPQTWNGYRALFDQWKTSLAPDRRDTLRRRVQMVAAMVPSNQDELYLRNFRDHAQECFAETLYDDETGQVDLDSFNFAPEDPDAPHYPLPVLFNADLVALDPAKNRNWADNQLVVTAYQEFLTQATALIQEAGESHAIDS